MRVLLLVSICQIVSAVSSYGLTKQTDYGDSLSPDMLNWMTEITGVYQEGINDPGKNSQCHSYHHCVIMIWYFSRGDHWWDRYLAVSRDLSPGQRHSLCSPGSAWQYAHWPHTRRVNDVWRQSHTKILPEMESWLRRLGQGDQLPNTG